MPLSHRDRNKKFTNTFQRCTQFPEELPLICAYCAFPRKAGILGHWRRGPADTTRPPRLQLTDWPLLAPPSPFCPPYPTPCSDPRAVTHLWVPGDSLCRGPSWVWPGPGVPEGSCGPGKGREPLRPAGGPPLRASRPVMACGRVGPRVARTPLLTAGLVLW